MGMNRRGFLRTSSLYGSAALLGESLLNGCAVQPPAAVTPGTGAEYQPTRLPTGSLLSLPASEAPIDHVVILMMENRSFDHYMGWLSRDEGYLERGLSRYGSSFSIDALSSQTFTDNTPGGTGEAVDTFHLPADPMANPWRGCGFNDPGHGWKSGYAQRDGGFLAPRSGNDKYALGYYEADDLPFHSRMARRFTTFDRYHCSALTSTQTNRRYLHGAQSGGYNYNYVPLLEGGFQWDTIWDRLRAANVSVGSYFCDVPSLAFWGGRMGDIIAPIDQYFERCATGTLPSVTFLDPPFLPWWQADDHPHSDPAAGQRFLRDVFRAFAESPHWQSGAFILTYDEWGGFFDHVAPPVLPDKDGVSAEGYNYAQAGFRVPTIVASPYAKPGFVDHTRYDHTSIMRFLQWRFLGAPPEGAGGDGAPWSLTERDRAANNIGACLAAENPDPVVFDLDDLPLRGATPDCEGGAYAPNLSQQPERGPRTTTSAPLPVLAPEMAADPVTSGGPGGDFEDLAEIGYFEQVGLRFEASSMAGTWVEP